MTRFTLAIVFIIFSFLKVFSQVEITAKQSKSKIGLNETFFVGCTVYSEDRDFLDEISKENIVFPNFENFEIISGLNEKKIISFADKKRTETYTFFYKLKPLKKGKFNIESASITINDKTYSSNSLSIKVGKAINLKNNYLVDIEKDIHLVAEVDKTNPYNKESMSLLYKIYYKEGLLFNGEFEWIEKPLFEKFYFKNIKIESNTPEKTTFNGEEYMGFTFNANYLTPKESGTIVIQASTVDVGIKVPTKDKDLFGETIYETITKTLISNEIKLEVSPFPENDKPDDFTEILGSFDIEVVPNKTEVSKNEIFEIDVTAAGHGNLFLFSIPRLEFSDGIEVVRTKVIQPTISLPESNFEIAHKYLLRIKDAGIEEIQAFQLSYFDPEKKEYITLSTEKIFITVKDDEIIKK